MLPSRGSTTAFIPGSECNGAIVTTPDSRYLSFSSDEWAALRASTPLTLTEDDLFLLRGINERISLDDWGYPIVDPRPIPRELEAHAERAAESCPVLALKLARRA